MMYWKDLPVAVLLVAGVIFSISTKRLTPAAALTGFVCGVLLYLGAGYTAIIMLTVFFALGTAATSWGRSQKQALEKPDDHAQRKSSQVLANSGAAVVFAVLMLALPQYAALFLLMLSASLASATADTLSSEMGMLYGKNFYNCLTWKKEARGMDGLVSLEGTLFGMAGAAVIAAIYAVAQGFNIVFLCIIIAGAAGNYADSVLGATLERRGKLNNDSVNFISTMVAAFIGLLFGFIFR